MNCLHQIARALGGEISSGQWRECRDYVKKRLGLRGPEMASTRPSLAREPITPGRSRKAANAARMWRESRDPRGTLAERHLRSRALDLPAEHSAGGSR